MYVTRDTDDKTSEWENEWAILYWSQFSQHSANQLGTGHYTGVIMGANASQITSLTIVYSTVYSDADQRKHQSSASLAFVRRIHRGPVNSPHKWPVTRKMFPFDDVIMGKRFNPNGRCVIWIDGNIFIILLSSQCLIWLGFVLCCVALST